MAFLLFLAVVAVFALCYIESKTTSVIQGNQDLLKHIRADLSRIAGQNIETITKHREEMKKEQK